MTPLQRLSAAAIFLTGTVFSVSPGHADLLLTVGDATVSQTGITTVDIFVSGAGGDQDLQTFDLVLELSPIDPSGDTSLIFVDPQTETHLSAEQVDNYVFVDTSSAILDGVETAAVDNGDPGFRQVTFSDDSLDDDEFDFDITVLSDPLERLLIASVDIEVGTGMTATAGDEFSLIVSTDSLFFNTTSFDEIGYSSVDGTLTIGPSAIPEPGTAAALLLLTGGIMMRRRRSH